VRVNRLRAVVFLLLAAAAGCGSSNPPYDCGHVPACGGDIVGTWSVVSSCVTPGNVLGQDFATSFCPTSVSAYNGGAEAYAGAWSFSSDLNYSIALYPVGTQSLVCSDGRTCAQQDTAIKALQSMDPTVQTAGCTAGGANCRCTYSIATLQMDSGTYTVDGTQLVLTSSTASPATYDFCVQGNTLHWILHGQGPPYPDVVFVRQSAS
jgi:hypothetical protein